MIELLVVIAIISILASLLLPAFAEAKRKPLQVQCLSNLKQIGYAMHMYMDEHRDTVPGPCYTGVSRRYCVRTVYVNGEPRIGPTQLLGYLASYLSLPTPPQAPLMATSQVAVCPAFLRRAPNPPPAPRYEGYSYFTHRRITNAPNAVLTNVWGRFDDTLHVISLPVRLAEIASPSSAWAVMDADKASFVYGPWHTNLPNAPVHGSRWNRLYFDSHAATVKKLD
jgi:type II secretory pathway pseudopilin PulG